MVRGRNPAQPRQRRRNRGPLGQLRRRSHHSRNGLALANHNLALVAALARGKRRTRCWSGWVVRPSAAAGALALTAAGCVAGVRRGERKRRDGL